MIWTMWEKLNTGTTFSMEFFTEEDLLDYEERYRPEELVLVYSKTIKV